MIIQCDSCSRKFVVKDSDIPKEGRMVRCGYCSVTWHQTPKLLSNTPIKKKQNPKTKKVDESLSVESIKASDGKTYKFLGSQWAELLPSGKTGLFAKKNIGKELDLLTGRKVDKIADNKKRKKTKKELDPSSEGSENTKRLPDIYRPKERLGFLGYVFLLIIIGFSLIGVLKTFENDLINIFPQMELIFINLDQQLKYLSETVKNIIVIINDLINSY